MSAAKKALAILCMVVSVLSIIFLIFLSFTSSFEGKDGMLPSILGLLSNKNDSLLNDFSDYFEKASFVPISQDEFWPFIFLLISFLLMLASPVLLLIGIVVLIINFCDFIKTEEYNYVTLKNCCLLVFFSQLFFVLCISCQMKQTFFLSLRFVAYVVFAIALLVYSELHLNNKTDIKISSVLKMTRAISCAICVVSLTVLHAHTPNTCFWQLFFLLTFVFTFIPPYIYANDGIHCIPLSPFAVILFSIVNKSFSVNVLLSSLIILLVYYITILADQYYCNLICVKYYYASPIKILNGVRKASNYSRISYYETGVTREALFFVLRYPIYLLGVAGSMIVAHLISYFLLGVCFGASSDIYILIGNILTVCAAGVLAFLPNYDNYFSSAWRKRNSALCKMFTYLCLSICFALTLIIFLLIDHTWNPLIADSRWTYVLILCGAWIAIQIGRIESGMFFHVCDYCHYITRAKVLSQKNKSYYKRHIEHVEGHYVNDYATTSSNYETTGTSSTFARSGSNMGSFNQTYDTNATTTTNMQTSGTHNTVIKKWVEGHDIDKGMYKHDVTISEKMCPICRREFTSENETSHKVD